ncbi:response regulator [Endozoicomonas atrinae]|uniref:response regulator n=1 Tax=Endozoicomonas atrinae TaxID=1333660 RepID=UPI003AFF9D87
MNILLIEDDDLLAQGVQSALMDDKWSVSLASRAHQALQIIRNQETRPDLIILDLGLPDMDGVDLLHRIKGMQHDGITPPVLVLTARDSISDKVRGLDSGADDYLTKPFDVEELRARLRVLERRIHPIAIETIRVGPVVLDTSRYSLMIDTETYTLPRREFALLRTLMESPGRVFSREQLIDRMYEWDEEISSNSVDVHIHNLRKKTGADFIRSIRGVGWLVVK